MAKLLGFEKSPLTLAKLEQKKRGRKMGLVQEKVKLLRGMDQYIRNASADEDDMIFDIWIVGGVPDGADDQTLEEIARDEELWINICKLFGELIVELEGYK